MNAAKYYEFMGARCAILAQGKGVPYNISDFLYLVYLIIMGNDDRVFLLFQFKDTFS
jgi:hypothetical protein